MSMKVSGHSPGKNGLVMLTRPEAKFEPEDIKLVPLGPSVKTETLDNLQREVMELKALLKKKSVETKRLRGEIERLQAQARMNNAATEALLEENESLRRKQIKIEQRAPRLHDALEHTEVIEIFDSEDEDQDPNDFADRNRGRPHITAPSRPLRKSVAAEALRRPSLTASVSSVSSRSSVRLEFDIDQDIPDKRSPSEESRLASPEPERRVSIPARVKREEPIDVDESNIIEVKVKQEDGSEEFKYVHLMKSENGELDIFNTDGFHLRPPIEVDEQYNVGFDRTVINHAFRGGPQECTHNWGGDEEYKGKPYCTFNRKWNPALPERPGQHGIVFCSFHTFTDGTVINAPLPFFCRENENDWRYQGEYNTKRWGEISSTHLKFLPQDVLKHWVEGALQSGWGKRWVERSNQAITERAEMAGLEPELIPYTRQGLHDALHDGTLIISFSIMECVGYNYDWYEKLVYRKAHPKTEAEKAQDKVNDAAGMKWRNEKRKQKELAELEELEMSEDTKRRKVEVEEDDDISNGSTDRQRSPPPRRTSRRKQKQARAISVEV